VFFGVFKAEGCAEVRDKGSEDTRMVDVQTFLVALLNMSKRYACFFDEAFAW
jgi:hypothetical protein